MVEVTEQRPIDIHAIENASSRLESLKKECAPIARNSITVAQEHLSAARIGIANKYQDTALKEVGKAADSIKEAGKIQADTEDKEHRASALFFVAKNLFKMVGNDEEARRMDELSDKYRDKILYTWPTTKRPEQSREERTPELDIEDSGDSRFTELPGEFPRDSGFG